MKPTDVVVLKGLLQDLATEMRSNSELWFPELHADPFIPLWVFYGLGMAGEAGEVANEVKKACRTRDGLTPKTVQEIELELADVFTYLLLMVDELGLDIITGYQTKASINNDRWG